MPSRIKFVCICLLLFGCNITFGQFNKDIKLKLSVGMYGLTPPSSKFIEEFEFSKTLSYSLGLEKDFKLNAVGNWLLRSEFLYNRTNIKVGYDYMSVPNGPEDHFKMDQILIPLKLVYVKNKFSAFVGLINNFNFETQIKSSDNDYFESVGTFNFQEQENSLYYEKNSVDKKYAIQYVAGFAIAGSSGMSYGLEFIDYFGYKSYYGKYFYDFDSTKQISSSALNLYVTFNLNKEQSE
jgi:hypothetical protein